MISQGGSLEIVHVGRVGRYPDSSIRIFTTCFTFKKAVEVQEILQIRNSLYGFCSFKCRVLFRAGSSHGMGSVTTALYQGKKFVSLCSLLDLARTHLAGIVGVLHCTTTNAMDYMASLRHVEKCNLLWVLDDVITHPKRVVRPVFRVVEFWNRAKHISWITDIKTAIQPSRQRRTPQQSFRSSGDVLPSLTMVNKVSCNSLEGCMLLELNLTHFGWWQFYFVVISVQRKLWCHIHEQDESSSWRAVSHSFQILSHSTERTHVTVS